MSDLDNGAKNARGELQLVIFRLGKEEYGLPITKVQEINRLVPVTKLPKTPPFMEGIINLRGRIIPVIDLRKRFQLNAEAYTDDTRILIAEVSGQTVGIVVDMVAEVIRLERAQVEPPPQTCILEARYIDGIGKYNERLIILLNIDSILTSQEDIVLREMKKELSGTL
jgi:purine-binding chemotaxis protein CheW